MEYREIEPSAATKSFIDRLWILTDDGLGGSAVQRVVPDGCPELILNLGQPFEAFQDGEWRLQAGCFLAGQMTGPLRLRPSGPAKILGVRFRPHGARQALGAAMHELTGRFLPIAEISPTLSRDLERARESDRPLAHLEAALLRSENKATVDQLVAEAVRRIGRGDCHVSGLADELALSTRQLERRFQNTVGLAPKLFCRIRRFSRVFRELEAGRNWVTAAVECGYYDQAHLVKDFREFSGDTPSALLSGDELARHFLKIPVDVAFFQDSSSLAPVSWKG